MKIRYVAGLLAIVFLVAFTFSSSDRHITEITRIDDLYRLRDIISIEKITTGNRQMDAQIDSWRILYKSDDCEVVGYITASKDYLLREEPIPVMIYNRGGNGNYGRLESPPCFGTGFVTFASQYRETMGGTGKDEFGGDDVHDVIKLLDFVDRCSFLDHDKVFMMGVSRGSIMTYEVIRYDPRVCAAIITGGIPDLFALYDCRSDMKQMLKFRIGGTPDEVPEEYEKRSASCWADEIDIPLLIFHTNDDWRAPIEPVDDFVSNLNAYGKEYTYIRMDTGGHCWSDPDIIRSFINHHLSDSAGETND